MSDLFAKAIVRHSEEVSSVMKSLSYAARLKILCALIEGEKTVGELIEISGLSQSSTSQLLGRMKAEAVLESRREGTRVYYFLTDKKLIKLLRAIKDIYCAG